MLKNEELLKAHGLKVTRVRLSTLETIQKSEVALSHAQLEKLNKKVDRVTLYRTLHIFEDKGIIHRVVNESGTVKYSGCQSDCDHSKPHDQHLHFSCNVCDKTVCLSDQKVEMPVLPTGYQLKNYYLLATGTCPSCAA